MDLVEHGADPDTRAHGDRLDVFDLADDLELHTVILDEWLEIGKTGSRCRISRASSSIVGASASFGTQPALRRVPAFSVMDDRSTALMRD